MGLWRCYQVVAGIQERPRGRTVKEGGSGRAGWNRSALLFDAELTSEAPRNRTPELLRKDRTDCFRESPPKNSMPSGRQVNPELQGNVLSVDLTVERSRTLSCEE